MSRILPRYIFDKNASTIETLIFNVEFSELTSEHENKIVAKFKIDLKTGNSKLIGKGILKNTKIIPPSIFLQDKSKLERLLVGKYKGHKEYFLTMFTAGKINQIMQNYKSYSSEQFMNWVENNLIKLVGKPTLQLNQSE